MRQEHSGTFQTIKNIATLYPQQRRAVHLNYFILVCFITLVFGVAMNVYRGYFSFAVSIFLFLMIWILTKQNNFYIFK